MNNEQRLCDRCGAVLAADVRFCEACGQRVEPLPPPLPPPVPTAAIPPIPQESAAAPDVTPPIPVVAAATPDVAPSVPVAATAAPEAVPPGPQDGVGPLAAPPAPAVPRARPRRVWSIAAVVVLSVAAVYAAGAYAFLTWRARQAAETQPDATSAPEPGATAPAEPEPSASTPAATEPAAPEPSPAVPDAPATPVLPPDASPANVPGIEPLDTPPVSPPASAARVPATRRSPATKRGGTQVPARQHLPAAPAAPAEEPAPIDEPAPTRVAPSPRPAGRPYQMTEVDVPPRVEMQSPPEYPEVARSLKLEDVVVVSVLVSETGSVSDARVLRHSSKWRGFDDAAVAAVRRWRFAPASDGGRHVACWYNVGVSFRLPR